VARLPRFPGAGLTHHVVQHGHNGRPIVLDDEDRRLWRALLGEALATTRVRLHGWVLLTDHFHLVLTPTAHADVGRLMQSLGRRYVAAFNRRHGCSGTLWDGRYRACLLEPGPEVLTSLRFVDTHLVRRGAPQDEALAWSSLGHHLGRSRDPWLTDPPQWWALGNTPFERERRYRDSLEAGPTEREVAHITEAALKGWALASPEFIQAQGVAPARPLAPRGRGRPRKAVEADPSGSGAAG